MRAVKGNSDCSVDPILQDISTEALSFECFKVSYIYKSMNVVTYDFAENFYRGDAILEDISTEALSFKCFKVSYIHKSINVVTYNFAENT